MQTSSATFLTALSAHDNGGSFDLADCVEVYASDYVPGVNGYDPDDAEMRFCGIEGYTFLALAYQREYVDRSDVQRYFDKKENTCTSNFSNISRALATWVQANDIEGKQLVIRIVSTGTSSVLADSLVIHTGRLDKPGDFDDATASLTATQRFGRINQKFPIRTFGPNDPQGRSPSDPLFEGFRITARTATVVYTTRERRQGLGGLVGLTKKITHSFQASSQTDVTADLAVPDAFGRVQLYGQYIGTLDIGGAINFSVAVCEGGDHGIDAYIAIKQVNPRFTQISANPARFYGYPGNTGPPGREQKPIRVLAPAIPNHPGDGYHSRTAWFAGFVSGSSVDIDEAEAPDWMILIKAKRIPVPDGSGDFSSWAWTHTPAYIARYLLSNERYFNEGEDAIEDAVCWATGLRAQEYVLDSSQGERVFLPTPDINLHGTEFSRFRSTGLVDSLRVRAEDIGDLSDDPQAVLAIPEPFDPVDPPGPDDDPDPVDTPDVRLTYLRERYTCNATLLEQMSALDFLHNVIAPTGRLYFVRNGKGKIEIREERPADRARLRAASSPGASTLAVTDAEPWKGGLLLTQKLLVGNSLTTSEVRIVTAADYTADGNSITLAASGSGGVTATVSGATLAGGSSSTPASGTITLTGSASGTITVTINGLTVQYQPDSNDTLASAALMLCRFLNATPKIQQFIKATCTPGATVVTVAARWGVLTLNAALANSHAAQVASPTVAPTLAAASGGVLPAGTYYVGFAYVTAVGQTALSPAGTVTVAANGKINTTSLGALPATALSVNWYVSKYANSRELVFWGNNDGTALSIGESALPVSSNELPPDINESGEELIRVAAVYATNDQGAAVLAQTGLTRGNIHKGTFKWPLPGKQSSTNMVAGTFFDATEDYAATPLEVHDFAHQERIRKVNKKEVDGSGFDNYNQFSRHLNFTLSKHREGDFFVSFQTGPAGMLHEEGDVICVSADSGGFVNFAVRIEELRIGKPPTYNVGIVARLYTTRMFSDRVRQHTPRLPTTLRHITPLDTLFQFLDLPPWREADAGLGAHFQIAAYRDPDNTGSWKGYSVWVNTGSGYREVAEWDVEAVTGVTLTAPPDQQAGYNKTGSIRVSLDNTENTLDSATDDELRAGKNLVRVGQEILQYKLAEEDIANPGEWVLSGILVRGRLGTEGSTTGHAVGEEFTVLGGAILSVPLDPVHAGGEIKVKLPTVNQDLADATEHTFTWVGYSRLPLAVSRVDLEEGTLFAPRASDGSVLVSSWPRTNLAGVGDQYVLQLLSDDRTEDRLHLYHREGEPSPGLLVAAGTDKYSDISLNTLTATGTTTLRAATLQRVRDEDNFVEATLDLGALPGSTSRADVGFVAESAQWRTRAIPDFYEYVVALDLNTVSGLYRLAVYVAGNSVFTLSNSTVTAKERVRVRLIDSRARFYRDWSGDGTPPFYESAVLPSFPLRGYAAAFGEAGTTVKVEEMMLTTNPFPTVLVTAAQQTAFLGGLKKPMQIRIRQQSSDPRLGFGLPYDAEI